MSDRRPSLGQAIVHIRNHKEMLQRKAKIATGNELTNILILKSSLNIALRIMESERGIRLFELSEQEKARVDNG
ncbi:MAG: hypothetical protein WCP82_11315 [Alphaproteobacteria bacterium]